MKPVAQRIAIAEACGWELVENSTNVLWEQIICNEEGLKGSTWIESDPLTDLNAMNEAEKSLTDDQHIHFCWHLVQKLDDNYATWSPNEFATMNIWEMSLHDIQSCLRATAAQRAEAFLRTLNLWTDDTP